MKPTPKKSEQPKTPKAKKEKIVLPTEFVPLSKEEKAEIATYGDQEARSLVSLYYSVQKVRMAAGQKIWADSKGFDVVHDLRPIEYVKAQLEFTEKQTAKALEEYAKSKPLGQWMLQINGVGPVIAAGLLAHIDLRRCCCTPYRHLKGKDRDWNEKNIAKGKGIPPHECPGLVTAGAIYRFAGLDPSVKWKKGEIRPWNVQLKSLVWKLGQSFKKITISTKKLALSADEMTKEQLAKIEKRKIALASPAGLYGRIYLERKALETQWNAQGHFRELARELLLNLPKSGLSDEQKAAKERWEAGELLDAAIDQRSCRYAEKIFLSHFHTVGREILGLPCVAPWTMAHGGHSHYIPPPCWPMTTKVKKVRAKKEKVAV